MKGTKGKLPNGVGGLVHGRDPGAGLRLRRDIASEEYEHIHELEAGPSTTYLFSLTSD